MERKFGISLEYPEGGGLLLSYDVHFEIPMQFSLTYDLEFERKSRAINVFDTCLMSCIIQMQL